MCVCVCMCVCVSVCVYVCVYLNLHVYIYVYINTCLINNSQLDTEMQWLCLYITKCEVVFNTCQSQDLTPFRYFLVNSFILVPTHAPRLLLISHLINTTNHRVFHADEKRSTDLASCECTCVQQLMNVPQLECCQKVVVFSHSVIKMSYNRDIYIQS